MGRIEHIFIAPERGARCEAVESVEAIADTGLKGDRYSDAKNRKDPGQQVTLIELEQIESFVRETGLAMDPSAPRRNLVTRGVELNALVGRRFRVGECELEGVELCEPCTKWARNTHKEVVRFFVHRGGLNARIVRGGVIAVGSSMSPR
ncbi:MAG TPA: MOSC domain-containing protein [Gammaproteobacteria bacterium]